jgi:extracellular factor (EF) 3-hydroxypalmitic acid methyl ester biosynthesis protein
LVRDNLFRLPRRETAAELLGEADFLFCTGLFDYLPDRDAAAMLRLFWQRLAPEGTMFVFNFSPRNSSRAYMEWIGNWYLIYRDEREMAQLARQARLPAGCFVVDAEALGVDLLLNIRKS